MTTAPALVSPQPKIDPTRAAAAPARALTRSEDEAPEVVAEPEADDRWADMPCTD